MMIPAVQFGFKAGDLKRKDYTHHLKESDVVRWKNGYIGPSKAFVAYVAQVVSSTNLADPRFLLIPNVAAVIKTSEEQQKFQAALLAKVIKHLAATKPNSLHRGFPRSNPYCVLKQDKLTSSRSPARTDYDNNPHLDNGESYQKRPSKKRPSKNHTRRSPLLSLLYVGVTDAKGINFCMVDTTQIRRSRLNARKLSNVQAHQINIRLMLDKGQTPMIIANNGYEHGVAHGVVNMVKPTNNKSSRHLSRSIAYFTTEDAQMGHRENLGHRTHSFILNA